MRNWFTYLYYLRCIILLLKRSKLFLDKSCDVLKLFGQNLMLDLKWFGVLFEIEAKAEFLWGFVDPLRQFLEVGKIEFLIDGTM